LTWLYLILVGIAGPIAGWLAHMAYQRLTQATRINQGPRSVEVQSGPPSPAVSIVTEAVAPSSNLPPKRLTPNANAAGRVILHLASLGRLGNDDVAKLGYTQRGMTEALGIPQGALAKVLSRLQEADIVESHRMHVSGEPRRLKVYRLTGLGESVARDLRHRPIGRRT